MMTALTRSLRMLPVGTHLRRNNPHARMSLTWGGQKATFGKVASSLLTPSARAKECGRKGEAERLRGPEIDDEIDLLRLLDQKSSGVLPITVLSFRVTLLPFSLNMPPPPPAWLSVMSL